jgi:pimeloyl-ACP methyl ester carboxylesterase|tara:strand:+ start:7240 stop:7989 length:750 start_codon:yes stop_codon:yes gene_type:complete
MHSIKYLLSVIGLLLSTPVISAECVILLHGLARTSDSMSKREESLSRHDYDVVNINYPSRKKTISELSELAINKGLQRCRDNKSKPVSLVTHSLGGILVRQYMVNHKSVDIARVVMLGPPNKGSEVVDKLKSIMGFKLINGPAGMQLGTAVTDVPKSLGPVNFELGVIAGSKSINLLLSAFLPNPDDGKVSVESTKVVGMCGFIVLPTTHAFMMKNKQVITEVIHFLKQGKFESQTASLLSKVKRHYCS